MKILNIITCYNEIDYLPYTVSFYQNLGIDLFILDNYSTDGSWEWIQEQKIPSERIDTKDAFDLKALQHARYRRMFYEKPDWVIYGDSDEFLIGESFDIPYLIELADREGFQVIRTRKIEFYYTGENRQKGDPRELFFYCKEYAPQNMGITRIHKYHPKVQYRADDILIPKAKTCLVRAFLLNYGATKTKEHKEDILRRRELAWERGLPKNFGQHYLKEKERDWTWSQKELFDIRQYEPLMRCYQ